ncbi:MAG TPA: hypothetical protein VJ787_04010 [Thermoleophilia bacterium]|nr:hypothetical protein [Thermoleophilia bacterium]
MCTWGTEKTIQITQTITVDACIAAEIVALNAAGVRTVGSCCGHGKGPSLALLAPSSYARAQELGYYPQWVGNADDTGCWGISIGAGLSKSLRRFLAGEEKAPVSCSCRGHGDACMCDDCKLRGLEMAADAREEADRKARPDEVDRSQLRATPEEVEALKRQMAKLRGEEK